MIGSHERQLPAAVSNVTFPATAPVLSEKRLIPPRPCLAPSLSVILLILKWPFCTRTRSCGAAKWLMQDRT